MTTLRTAVRRVLRQVDRGQQAERHRHAQRDQRQVDRAPDQREHAERLLLAGERRRPLGPEQVVGEPDVPKKLIVSSSSDPTIASVVTTESPAAANSDDADRALEPGTGAGGPGQLDPAPRRAGGRRESRLGHMTSSPPGRRPRPWTPHACSSVIGTIFAASAIDLVVVDHEVHERLDLGARERLVGRVHEQRARERRVGAVLDRLGGRLDAAVRALADADEVQLVLAWPRSRRSRSSRGRLRSPRRP